MTTVDRRRFIAGAAAGTGFGLAFPAVVGAQSAAGQRSEDAAERTVRLSGDGVPLTPLQYSQLLARLAEERRIGADSYSIGGVVEQLETEFARLLGKERAVFMPTGTLANSIAVRTLAGGPSRVIVQQESHLYLDEGDCAQTLSNLTLIPLAAGRATFTADDVQGAIDQAR